MGTRHGAQVAVPIAASPTQLLTNGIPYSFAHEAWLCKRRYQVLSQRAE